MTDLPDSAAASESNESYWNRWNRQWRLRAGRDEFMQRQLEVALAVAQAEKLREARILGVGCGTGWLEQGLLPFGQAWGTDLSPEAIADGRVRHPQVNLLCCDFLEEELPGPFDLVVSADSLVPMADHERCIVRVAELLRPRGIFLLMTQNPAVWKRRSAIRHHAPSVPHARPEEWPTLHRVRDLLHAQFDVEAVSTIVPGGDRGLLWWVENRFVQGLMGRLIGAYRWRVLLERAGLGRELIVVARRR